MTPEITLQDPPIACAIEKGTPGFQFADARWSFLRMEFCHSPVTQILAAAHRVGKVNAPVIAVIGVRERGGDASFSHNRVRLAQKRFRDHRYLHTRRRGFDGGAQTGASCANHEHIVFMLNVLGH
jgi:hypothetical protein